MCVCVCVWGTWGLGFCGGLAGFMSVLPRPRLPFPWWQRDASREGTGAGSGFCFGISTVLLSFSFPPSLLKTFFPFSPHLPLLLFSRNYLSSLSLSSHHVCCIEFSQDRKEWFPKQQSFALHASCLFLCWVECVGVCVLKARVNTENKHFKLQTQLKHVQTIDLYPYT